MKFAHYDISGNIIGFYDNAIHTDIPESVIEISNNDWATILSNPDTKIVSGGVLTTASSETLLALAKNKKLAALKTQWVMAASSTISSSALGAPHTYQSNTEAQMHLNSLIIKGASANLLYFDDELAPVLTLHTLSQLQEVLTDLLTAKQTAATNYASKVILVTEAVTVNAVEAIEW